MDINPEDSAESREGLFSDFWEASETMEQQERLADCWNLPTEFGTGSHSNTELRPGLNLVTANYQLRKSIATKDAAPEAFGFIFVISGLIKNRLDGVKDDFITKGGQSELVYYPGRMGLWEESKKKRMFGLSIFIKPELFRNLIQEDCYRTVACFSGKSSGEVGKSFYHTDYISPFMQTTLSQVFNCPYCGSTKRLYLEGKAIELIAQKIGQIEADQRRTPKRTTMKSNDVERVLHARELLIRDLEHPPRISDLARSVGLTHNRLIIGFREIYNTTPFIYLRNMRLYRAKMLLDEGMVTVSEAAYSVGYASLSHFARAFNQYFGITPSDYLHKSPGN